MPVYRNKEKCLRDYQLASDDAARAICINRTCFVSLVEEGFIVPAPRKGFYRLGSVLDGYAEAVRVGRIKPPHDRANSPVTVPAVELLNNGSAWRAWRKMLLSAKAA